MSGIGLMGGSFDPIHYAHTDIAVTSAKEMGLEKVILIPAHIQPFKQHKDVSQDHHRINMLQLAIETQGEGLLEISDYEMKKGGVSYTFDTVRHFKELLPGTKLWFILGSDSFKNVESWYKGPELLAECGFGVASRPGDSMEEILHAKERYERVFGTEVFLIQKKMLPISSTMVREYILEDKPISGIVTPEVENYIYENKLYI